MQLQPEASLDIRKCEVFRWFDVKLESRYRSPRQVAVSVQWSKVFKHQQLNTTASPCCGPLFAVKNSIAHTSQLISLLGFVWVSLAHFATTLLHGFATHTTIWWFHALLMARWCMFYTYRNSPIWLWRTAMQQKCMQVHRIKVNAKTYSGVFLQQPCSWVVAPSESKGPKALHDDCGCIYPSRPCSQVELLQCGCSRKLVWISRSVKWFDAQLQSWQESKTSGCKCPMIKSIQASTHCALILTIVQWFTLQTHWRFIGDYKVLPGNLSQILWSCRN